MEERGKGLKKAQTSKGADATFREREKDAEDVQSMVGSPSLSESIQKLSSNMKALMASSSSRAKLLENLSIPNNSEPKSPYANQSSTRPCSPGGDFNTHSTFTNQRVVEDFLSFMNSANKEELKKIRGIGEKYASYILELREETPDPFKTIEDLQEIGLSAKQVEDMIRRATDMK